MITKFYTYTQFWWIMEDLLLSAGHALVGGEEEDVGSYQEYSEAQTEGMVSVCLVLFPMPTQFIHTNFYPNFWVKIKTKCLYL